MAQVEELGPQDDPQATAEPPAGPSRAAGIAVATAVVLGALTGLWAVSRTAFVLIFWTVAWGLLIREARKVPGTPDPAPPAPSERGSEKEPQVNVVRDTSHPNRWIITRETPWLAYEHDDRDGS